MIRTQLMAILHKPSVRLKIFLITLLFIPTLIEQLTMIVPYADSFGKEGQVTVAIMLLHVFNYLYFYVDVLLAGFILLIPDIVRDEYIDKQAIMFSVSRKKAAGISLARIVSFSVLYVLWFVLLTVMISGVWLRNFSLAWPHFISVIQKQAAGWAGWYMQLIMLPENCMDYPVLVVLFLVVVRSTLGFIFLGMLASLMTLLTKKIKYGVGIVFFLVAVTLFLYYDFDGGFLLYYDASVPAEQARVMTDLIKVTLVPLFTFRSLTDNFTYWIRYGILCGMALCIVTSAGIWLYYQKGDLDNADQDE